VAAAFTVDVVVAGVLDVQDGHRLPLPGLVHFGR
jgi:hypothetical protein